MYKWWGNDLHKQSRTWKKLSSVQSLSRVQLFVTPWTATRQVSLSITNSRSSLKLMSIESMMPSSHLILGRPLLLLPPIPPSIRVFSNESTLRSRWPKYWSFSFSIIPSKEIPGLISFRMDWLDLLAVQGMQLIYFLYSYYMARWGCLPGCWIQNLYLCSCIMLLECSVRFLSFFFPTLWFLGQKC